MTIPVSHLPGCYKTSRADPSRYTCNCGADSQNERAAMLDRAEASAHSHRVGDASPETAEPWPPPDASLEAAERTWRGEWQRIAADLRSMSESGKTPADILAILLTHLDRMPPLAVVRAVDASRPAAEERTFPRVSLSTVVPGSLVEIASGDIGIAIRFDGGNLRPIAWITTGHVGTMPASATVSLRATPTELDALTSADGSQPAEDPLAIPLSRYADGLEQVAAQGGCSVATADKLLRAVVAIRCAISGEPLSRAADASQAEVVAMRAALTAVGFPPRPNESLVRTFECAWTWCVGLAHKEQVMEAHLLVLSGTSCIGCRKPAPECLLSLPQTTCPGYRPSF